MDLELPEDNSIFALVFWAEIIQTLVREAIFLSVVPSNSGSHCKIKSLEDLASMTTSSEAAIATLVVTLILPGLMIILILASILLCFLKCCVKHEDNEETSSPMTTFLKTFFTREWKSLWKSLCSHSRSSLFIFISQCTLLVFYSFGDNIDYIMYRFGAGLSCTGDCLGTVSAVAKTLSILSALLLSFSPHGTNFAMKRWKSDWNYKQNEFEKKMCLFGTIVKIEAVYNALLVAAQHNRPCHKIEHGLGWTVFIVIGIITVVGQFYEDALKNCKANTCTKGEIIRNYTNCKMTTWKKFGVGTMILFLMYFFLLSDNSQPLDCAFNCDTSGPPSNTTTDGPGNNLNTICCDIIGNAITRLVFIILSLVIASLLSEVGFYQLYKHYKTKVAPEKN